MAQKVKEYTHNTQDPGDTALIPGLGRSPGGGNGNPFQYSCLENSMDRGTWWATVYGVAQSQTWFSTFWFSSIQSLSLVQLFTTSWTAATRLPCPLPTPGACSNSCPSSQWYHPAILFSFVPLSSCLQSFPASGSFQLSQFSHQLAKLSLQIVTEAVKLQYSSTSDHS